MLDGSVEQSDKGNQGIEELRNELFKKKSIIINGSCGVSGFSPFLALHLSPTPSGFVLFGEPSLQDFGTLMQAPRAYKARVGGLLRRYGTNPTPL